MQLNVLQKVNKRIVLAIVLIIALAANFWTGSRYPSLNDKAIMGGEAQLEDPLSFESLLPVEPSDPALKKIVYVTINWANTNRQGMTFGLLFGAAFLTFLGYLKRRSHKNGFVNSLMGMITGAPLGVCVNCAAPIAKGLHDAGARLEMTLATMISSPALNIVVVTMMFSLFPIYLVVTKLAVTFVLILLLIPLLARFVFPNETLATVDNAACKIEPLQPADQNETWYAALRNAALDYLKNLWYIVYRTVPLMFLAGLLGAIFVTFLPLETFISSEITVIGVIVLAIVGVFLPVPIAFDVVVTAALLAGGLPIIYVMILLFSLGTYSVYSFFIMWQSISKRVAITMYVTVALLSIISGIIVHHYHNWELQKMMDYLVPEANASEKIPDQQNIRISKTAFQERIGTDKQPFTRHEGRDYGLIIPNTFDVSEFWEPFFNGRGLASGDVNNDGYADMLLATENGVLLYINRAGKKFTSQKLDIPSVSKLNVFAVALVDINNDGWLDIYLTTYREGNHYILSDKGSFTRNGLHKTPMKGNVVTISLAFGDIDRDGDLDASLGNFFASFPRTIPSRQARNYLHYYHDNQYIEKNIDEHVGETLSTLLSDFDQDGDLDLISGNDHDISDMYYLGDGKGGLKKIWRDDGLMPGTTHSTMSIDTADIDNDLDLEIYLAQIAGGTSNNTIESFVLRSIDDYCEALSVPKEKSSCERNMAIKKFVSKSYSKHKPSDIKHCLKLADKKMRTACKGMMVMKTAVLEKKQAMCGSIPKSEERTIFLCNLFFTEKVVLTDEEKRKELKQRMNKNVFLFRNKDGTFYNMSDQLGLALTAWAWNAKFGDVDNDEWQDMYVVNGTWLMVTDSSNNLFYHNQGGKSFIDQALVFGLENFMIVSAYTYIDIDNDGDLDIITNSVNGPVWVYINNEQDNNSVAFRFVDKAGNRFGIGNKIIIHYGDKGSRHQIREIKAGGGYLSIDAPVAHFGLGRYKRIDRLEVHWSTGDKTVHEGPFEANNLLTITRGD